MSLIDGFLEAVSRYPGRPALDVAGKSYSYADLHHQASRISQRVGEYSETQLVGILAYRSLAAYAGILGVLLSGRGYVPFHPDFPGKRAATIVAESGLDCLIIGNECQDALRVLLAEVRRELTLIFPFDAVPQAVRDAHGQHHFVGPETVRSASAVRAAPEVKAEDVAYLMFTSGSTGSPKGVPITHANVAAYLDYMCERLGVAPSDRVAQMSDITFDVSVHDMFVCWERGACLCVVPHAARLAPASFIREREITIWTSVPTVAVLLKRMRMLKPGSFPALRASIFTGEALPATIAEAWAQAAPDSIIENHYGATEGTVNFTAHRWVRGTDPAVCINGVVPIGRMFDDQKGCVIDADEKPVPQGQVGELCVSGTQVTPGYWKAPEHNGQKFIRIDGFGNRRWYRTGDLVKEDGDGILHYIGRVDHQVQIRGYRVELQEVDFVLRRAAQTEMAATVAWPVQDGRAEGLIAFVETPSEVDITAILDYCKQHLPSYMVPRTVHVIPKMPLNVNGKIDRKQLVERIEQQYV